MPKAIVVLKDMEKLLLTDDVEMHYTLETLEPNFPHEETENIPELSQIALKCGIRPKGLKSYPKALGFESDVEFELLFSTRYLATRGFDVVGDAKIRSQLSKANFLVNGFLCTSVKTPELHGKITGISTPCFITFYLKRMARNRA